MATNSKSDEKSRLWKQRIKACRNSSLTAKSWCEKHQVKYHSLKYWITKFNKEKQTNKHTVTRQQQWVNIQPSKTPKTEAASGIHVHVGQYKVLVQKDFDQNTLKKIVQTLGQC